MDLKSTSECISAHRAACNNSDMNYLDSHTKINLVMYINICICVYIQTRCRTCTALRLSQWSSISPLPGAFILSVTQTNPSVYLDDFSEEFLFKIKERKPVFIF